MRSCIMFTSRMETMLYALMSYVVYEIRTRIASVQEGITFCVETVLYALTITCGYHAVRTHGQVMNHIYIKKPSVHVYALCFIFML